MKNNLLLLGLSIIEYVLRTKCDMFHLTRNNLISNKGYFLLYKQLNYHFR